MGARTYCSILAKPELAAEGLSPIVAGCGTVCAMSKVSIMIELWEFLRVRKKMWLLPLVVFLVLVGVLLVFSESSAVAPFIYTLF
jgi:hypothetical protein